MRSERLTAFTDGVIAVIITIMVLDLRVPSEASFTALLPVGPKLLAYALSFVIAAQGEGSPMAKAIGRDLNGKLTPLLYRAGIGLAFVSTGVSQALYAIVALIWLVPDRRIEAVIAGKD